MHSALDPHGPAAEAIARLGWVMFTGAALILAIVVALALYAVLARRRRYGFGGRVLLLAGGVAFPVVTLSGLLIWGLNVAAGVIALGPAPLRIDVVGERWWWRVTYLGEDGAPLFATANELRIPVGKPVELVLRSDDVIHSFWVPSLAGKLDMIPGHVNRLRLRADRPGQFRGQCAEYCGGPHALMAFHVIAEPPDRFAAWLARQREEAGAPDAPLLARGRELFLANGCGACHTVRGTEADGRIGPDLTHVGSRVAIAAGMFPTNAGTLAGWIADSQHLKPENLMPSYTGLGGPDLRAIAVWLHSLE